VPAPPSRLGSRGSSLPIWSRGTVSILRSRLLLGRVANVEFVAKAATDLSSPHRLWTAAEMLASPSPIPAEAGLYAWYFREIPARVPTEGCPRFKGSILLYVGISPARPVSAGGPVRQNLRRRLRAHLRGNASGSTLRLTLGCLLRAELGLTLRRVGSGERMTFAAGEAILTEWMAANACATWAVHPQPWEVEGTLIDRLSPPLNLAGAPHQPFHKALAAMRGEMRSVALSLPILNVKKRGC